MNSESSTFEMETKNNFEAILNAITEMRQEVSNRLDKIDSRLDKVDSRLDKIEAEQAELKREFNEYKQFSEAQFEAVRQGIVKNYNQSDRLVSEISQTRSVIYSVKADLGELNEKVYLLTRSNETALKS